jgi:hypothetical protein
MPTRLFLHSLVTAIAFLVLALAISLPARSQSLCAGFKPPGPCPGEFTYLDLADRRHQEDNHIVGYDYFRTEKSSGWGYFAGDQLDVLSYVPGQANAEFDTINLGGGSGKNYKIYFDNTADLVRFANISPLILYPETFLPTEGGGYLQIDTENCPTLEPPYCAATLNSVTGDGLANLTADLQEFQLLGTDSNSVYSVSAPSNGTSSISQFGSADFYYPNNVFLQQAVIDPGAHIFYFAVSNTVNDHKITRIIGLDERNGKTVANQKIAIPPPFDSVSLNALGFFESVSPGMLAAAVTFQSGSEDITDTQVGYLRLSDGGFEELYDWGENAPVGYPPFPLLLSDPGSRAFVGGRLTTSNEVALGITDASPNRSWYINVVPTDRNDDYAGLLMWMEAAGQAEGARIVNLPPGQKSAVILSFGDPAYKDGFGYSATGFNHFFPACYVQLSVQAYLDGLLSVLGSNAPLLQLIVGVTNNGRVVNSLNAKSAGEAWAALVLGIPTTTACAVPLSITVPPNITIIPGLDAEPEYSSPSAASAFAQGLGKGNFVDFGAQFCPSADVTYDDDTPCGGDKGGKWEWDAEDVAKLALESKSIIPQLYHNSGADAQRWSNLQSFAENKLTFAEGLTEYAVCTVNHRPCKNINNTPFNAWRQFLNDLITYNGQLTLYPTSDIEARH